MYPRIPTTVHVHTWWVRQVNHGLNGTLLKRRGVTLDSAAAVTVNATRWCWLLLAVIAVGEVMGDVDVDDDEDRTSWRYGSLVDISVICRRGEASENNFCESHCVMAVIE